jgi:hypothetical protein
LLVLTALAGALGLGGSVPPVAALGSEVQIDIPTAGRLGAITVIGDSVLVGTAIEPSLATLLSQDGFGPVRFRAGLGYTAGNFQPANSHFSVVNYLRQWKAAGWDAPNVVVNLGNNDVGFCKADVACNVRTIEFVLDALGPGHTVWWSKITRFPFLQPEADAYNAALDQVAAERGNLVAWDWPAVEDVEQLPMAWDHIHLPDGPSYRRRSELMAADITAQLSPAVHTGIDAPLPVSNASKVQFRPLDPTRVLDTRDHAGARLATAGTATVDLSAVVPAGTTAVAVNITAVDPAAAGFLTGYPCGSPQPDASSGNYSRGGARSTMSVLQISADGRLCVFSSAATDVVVDLQGAFTPAGPATSGFTPAPPSRVLDTRESGRAALLQVQVPAGSSAVALNIAVTGSSAAGFVAAYPCGGSRPFVANVTFGAAETVSDAAYVAVGPSGTVCLESNVPVDVVVDLTGTFSASGALSFVAAPSTRTFDSRDGTGGWLGIQPARQVDDVRVAPPEALAVTGVLTMVTPRSGGFLTAFGCSGTPTTASVNAPALAVVANTVTVGLANGGRMCTFGSATTHIVFDTTGWWVS